MRKLTKGNINNEKYAFISRGFMILFLEILIDMPLWLEWTWNIMLITGCKLLKVVGDTKILIKSP